MSSGPYSELPPGSKSQPYVQGPPAEGYGPPTSGYTGPLTAGPPTGGYSRPTGPPTGGYGGPPSGGGVSTAPSGGAGYLTGTHGMGYPRPPGATQPGMANLTSEVNRMSMAPRGKSLNNVLHSGVGWKGDWYPPSPPHLNVSQ